MDWILNNLGTIISSVIILMAVIGIIVIIAKNKSISCGGSCGSCPMGNSCGSFTDNKPERNEIDKHKV
ncbi:MAG: FeoB-associated Cys-rich membrane protein [Ruminococcaceae bacterium]|nr:FeoB-associated Cys-rich membrane protein [Oscillospiraceae bacterium]